jgi:hypothetical protein
MHDTGLHYDDEDGVLTVIEGCKDIILFPPSDTQYLYPYEVSYEWKESKALNYRYNTAQKICEIDGISSGELLYVTCNHNKRVLSNISKLYEKYNDANLIWGFKKNGDEYRWEIYRYTLHNKLGITSWDIHDNQYNIENNEHYYYKMDDTPLSLPYWGYGECMINGVLKDESKIFVIDQYQSFYNNYDSYMNRLEYQSIKEKFKNIILKKYSNCYQICIFNKTPNQIFVMYMGLTNEEFLEFLIENKYPTYVTDFVQEKININAYKINNEVAVVYDIETQEVIRTGFYGNI